MTNRPSPLVALISATPTAIPPVERAFADLFPQARLWNILDDRLLQSADDVGGLTPALESRMHRLIRHALLEGADAILLTCSIYGSAIRTMPETAGVPVQAADEASFDSVVAKGYRSVGLVSSARAPLADSVTRLTAHVGAAGADIEIHPVEAFGAFDAARSGDVELLAGTLATAVADIVSSVDVILLGQYSLAPAAQRLSELTGLPVLAGPQRAAGSLREMVAKGMDR